MVSVLFSLLLGCTAEEHLSLLQTRAMSTSVHKESQPHVSEFEFEGWLSEHGRSCTIKTCAGKGKSCVKSHPINKKGTKGNWGSLGKNVTLDDCFARCLKTRKCRYVSYNDKANTCTGWKTCVEKESQGDKPHLRSFRKVLRKPRSMILTAKRHVKAAQRCAGKDRIGQWGELGHARHKVTEQECKSRCGKTPECMFASLDDHRGCNMYRRCDTPIVAKHDNERIQTSVWTVAIPHMFMPCGKKTTSMLKTQCLDKSTYAEIVASVRKQYNALSIECTDKACQQASWAGCILRMAGHDFMDFKNGTGGSDGCTDMTDIDNGGLAECLIRGEFGQSIHLSYEEFCETVSLADFLVIASEAVMQITREQAIVARPGRVPIQFESTFKFGRTTKTVDTCTFEEGLLPNPEDSCPAVERVFMDNMGLTSEQSVALSAVHSLGRARKEVSGYDGWWSDPENSRLFNNDYFVSIINKGWKRKINSREPQKTQWVRGDRGQTRDSHEMMLNSDMCLLYGDRNKGTLQALNDNCCAWVHTDLEDKMDGVPEGVTMKQVLVNGGNEFCGASQNCAINEPGCPANGGTEFVNCCVNHPGADCGGTPNNPKGGLNPAAVFQFAADDTTWANAFLPAWNKATENGFEGLQSLTDTC